MHISIIFVHYGMNEERRELARESMRSLIRSVNDSPTEIIIVDNGNNAMDSRFFLDVCHDRQATHYIRNAENMHFGFARNQALAMATGDYIAIVDNDLEYERGWLAKCVDFLEAHKDKKYLATPIAYPMHSRYRVGEVKYKNEIWRLDLRAGSNCWVMSRAAYQEIGNFQMHRIAGSIWTTRAVRLGYVSAVTPQNMVIDQALRKGYNLNEGIVVQKYLLDKQFIKLN